MNIPHWLAAPILVSAVTAILGSLVPIATKLLIEWSSRRARQSLVITLADGSKISVEGKSLDEKKVRELNDLLARIPKDKSLVAATPKRQRRPK